MQHDHGFEVLHTDWPLSHTPFDSRSCLDSSSNESSEMSQSRDEIRDGGWHTLRRTGRQRSSGKSARATERTDTRPSSSPTATRPRHSASPVGMAHSRYSSMVSRDRGGQGEAGHAAMYAEAASGSDAESVMSSSSRLFARPLKSVRRSPTSPTSSTSPTSPTSPPVVSAARQPVPLSGVVVASPRMVSPTTSSSEFIRQVDAQIGSHGRRNLVRHVTGSKRCKAPTAGPRSPHQTGSAPGSAAGMLGSLPRQHASLPMLLSDDRMQISKV